MNNYFFIYPKDKEGKPIGNTICVFNYDGRNYIGEAICSKKDNFDKATGRQLALDRAMRKAMVETSKNIVKQQTKEARNLVSEYSEHCDLNRYPGESAEERPLYKVTKRVEDGYKYPSLKRLKVQMHPQDLSLRKEYRGFQVVELISDGNGVDVVLNSRKDSPELKFRLNYSQVTELKLALQKYHEHYRTGKFKRIKL